MVPVLFHGRVKPLLTDIFQLLDLVLVQASWELPWEVVLAV